MLSSSSKSFKSEVNTHLGSFITGTTLKVLMQLLKVLCGAVEAAAATASDGSSQDQNCDEATQDHNFDIVQCLLQVLTFVP